MRLHIALSSRRLSDGFFDFSRRESFRFKELCNGARQVLDILLPGDLIGLQSPFTGQVRHTVCALTPVTLGATEGGRTEVTGGLTPGAEVVVRGVHSLTQGQAVGPRVAP